MPRKSIGPTLETRQSHTIEYWVSKIVPEGHREGNKSPAVLRGSAARRCISVPMCDQSTACNPHWHILSRWSTIKMVHRVTPDLIKHTQDCHVSTMSNVTLKHIPVRNLSPLTARSSSLRCVSAAKHQTGEQYSKTSRTKPRNHLPRSHLSWSTRQDFLKIPSPWEAALETERRCFSNVIFESNVTPNIIRSSDSFSTVPPIVNGGDWGYIVRNLEIIRCLGLTRIQFHPPKVTPLTKPAKVTDQGYRNSDARGWHNCHQSGVISITAFPKWKKTPKCTWGTIAPQNTALRHSWPLLEKVGNSRLGESDFSPN